MIRKIAFAVAGLVTGVLVYAATKPATLHVARSATIEAPPEAIHPLINDFHHWTLWSPYEKKDPGMKRTFSGAQAGKGAIYEWDGNNDVGSGRMEVLDTSRSRITIKLDFIRPFEGHNIAEFTLEPRGGATHVTWSIEGPNSFMAKVMSIFMDMDELIGADFEVGLENMKSAARAGRGSS